MAQLLVPDRGLLFEDAGGQHEKARRAEAALQPVVIPERLLERMQLLAIRQALDRPDLGAFSLHGEHQARPDRIAVQHAENVGGEKVLDRRCVIGAFPWKYEGLESCPCRIIAFFDVGETKIETFAGGADA